MKKITALLLTLCLIFTLAACGGSKGSTNTDADKGGEDADTPAEIPTVSAGKLMIATSPDFAPYEFYSVDDKGNYTLAGFDIELGKYIADYLGLEAEIVPMDFDGVLLEVTAKSVDIGLAGLSPTADRAEKMDFSNIYYTGGQSFVTNPQNADKIKSLSDANKAEYQIAAQNGSIQHDLALEHTPDADIVVLSKVTDIVAELVAGTINGAFIETVVAECYQKNFPELVIVCEVPFDSEGSAVAVSKGNTALLDAVNAAIEAALADGSMNQFVADANELATGEVFEGILEK